QRPICVSIGERGDSVYLPTADPATHLRWLGLSLPTSKGAMAVDLATVVSRWSQSAAGAQTKYTEGVQTTSKDPTALAIAPQGPMVANFQQAVSSGRWQQHLAAVGKAGW